MLSKLLPFLLIFSACARFKFISLETDEIQRAANHSQELPRFYLLDYQPTKTVKTTPPSNINGRKIASVDSESKKAKTTSSETSSSREQESKEQENVDILTNKQIYFLTLLQQYKIFNRILNVENQPQDLICPQFHDDLLTHQGLLLDYGSYSLNHDFDKALEKQKALASFPVLALPYKGADIYSVWKQDSSIKLEDSILHAILEFNKRNYAEIERLCQFGYSDNYYIFENLVQYYSDESVFYDSNALHTLVRLPVFANMLLLDGLKDGTGESLLRQMLLERGQLGWFRNYLDKLRDHRKNGGKFSTYRSLSDERNSFTYFNFPRQLW